MSLIEALLQACSEHARDTRTQKLIRETFVEPLRQQIEEGKLDDAIGYALARVTMPLIAIAAVVLLLSIGNVAITLRLLLGASVPTR